MSTKLNLPQLTEEHLEQIQARLHLLKDRGFIYGYDREQQMCVMAIISEDIEIESVYTQFPIDEVTSCAVSKIFNPGDLVCVSFAFEPTHEGLL